jgi:site-specific DNA recombinase
MKAAVYARYSSDNQRPESIADQVSACRRFAADNGHVLLEDHVYTDEALSGARRDRPGLQALRDAAGAGAFELVLLDDLSRLARDNYLMLTILAELEFDGIRVISVADGVDSGDEDATLSIHIRGLFNEIQLQDLKKKTLRGQLGQKDRGFFVGERTFGYRSVPVGELRMDKKGRPRPDGYTKEINPTEAAIVLRIFKEFADGRSQTSIVQTLNEEGIPGAHRQGNKWSPSTVHRILTSEKYIGKWVWNRTGSRKDPTSGRRRPFEKPESEWKIHEDEALRIIPKDLWKKVQARKAETTTTWPGGKGRRGFSGQRGSKETHYPTHLLAGTMHCSNCEGTIGQVSGKAGGYYGCLRASKRACDNKVLVRRSLAESIIIGAVAKKVGDPEHLQYVLRQVEKEIEKQRSHFPEEFKMKQTELAAEERRLDNFINAIGEGNGSKALGQALSEAERRTETLRDELDGLQKAREKRFKVPSTEWIKEHIAKLQELLEKRTEQSALVLRKLLGPIRLEPVAIGAGKPFYRAFTAIDTLALVEIPLDGAPVDAGSSALRQWRRPESNRHPWPRCEGFYRLSRRLVLVSRGPRRRALRENQPLGFPWRTGRSTRVSPLSEAGAPPRGRGRTDSRCPASN